jgi:hypothetical protein
MQKQTLEALNLVAKNISSLLNVRLTVNGEYEIVKKTVKGCIEFSQSMANPKRCVEYLNFFKMLLSNKIKIKKYQLKTF